MKLYTTNKQELAALRLLKLFLLKKDNFASMPKMDDHLHDKLIKVFARNDLDLVDFSYDDFYLIMDLVCGEYKLKSDEMKVMEKIEKTCYKT